MGFRLNCSLVLKWIFFLAMLLFTYFRHLPIIWSQYHKTSTADYNVSSHAPGCHGYQRCLEFNRSWYHLHPQHKLHANSVPKTKKNSEFCTGNSSLQRATSSTDCPIQWHNKKSNIRVPSLQVSDDWSRPWLWVCDTKIHSRLSKISTLIWTKGP